MSEFKKVCDLGDLDELLLAIRLGANVDLPDDLESLRDLGSNKIPKESVLALPTRGAEKRNSTLSNMIVKEEY